MSIARNLAPLAGALLMGCASATQLGQGTATNPGITAQDLRARLYAFADDSMMGRQFGTEGNLKAAQYIANELARVGVQPGSAGGSYFQDVPAYRVSLAPASQVLLDGAPLVVGTDYITNFPGSGRAIQVDSVQVVYGGDLSDTTTLLPADQAAGRAVLLTIRTPLQRNPGPILARYAAARTIITANDPRAVRPYAVTMSTDTTPARLNLVVSPSLAARLVGGDPLTMRAGAPGGAHHLALRPGRPLRHETSSASSPGWIPRCAANTSRLARTTITSGSGSPVHSITILCGRTTSWRTGSWKHERMRPPVLRAVD